jgi:hypothetical protein
MYDDDADEDEPPTLVDLVDVRADGARVYDDAQCTADGLPSVTVTLHPIDGDPPPTTAQALAVLIEELP